MAEEVKCVQLKRSDSYGFGFSILGGCGSELPPIIYDIIENSPAAVSGELEAGDVILEVNEKEVFTLTTKEVLKCLRLSSDLVRLKLKRDPVIKEKVRSYLAASNDMDTLKRAITKEDLDGVSEIIVRRTSVTCPTSTNSKDSGSEAVSGVETNGMHEKTLKNGSSVQDGEIEEEVKAQQLEQQPSWTPPRFETYMMTGDLILNLNAKASGSNSLVSKPKRVDYRTPGGQSSAPASPEDGDARYRGKGLKRESPSLCSPVADKKTAFAYPTSFVRTSRSEDHLQKDFLTTVNIDIDDDITSSVNTLLDTRHDNPANERIVWTYNAPISHDSVSSSSPHSSSPSSPLQSPTYKPLRSTSPTKQTSSKRRAPGLPRSNSTSPASSPTSVSCPLRLGDEQTGVSEPLSPTSSEECHRTTDFEGDGSVEGSPRMLQNGVFEKSSSGMCEQSNDGKTNASKTTSNLSTNDLVLPIKDKGHTVNGWNRAQDDSSLNSNPSSDVNPITSKRELRKSTSPPPDDDSDIDSLHSFHYSPKAVDMPSASRLAKRLYNLEGFKKSDVSRHLCKNNEFSRVVAEEYLKFFDFTGDPLDVALRKFLRQFCLTGETQERERVLVHFSNQYLNCNPGTFNSQDAVHTLTCALMLLNTDLHGQNIGRKMTCAEFIDNLAELNDGENFPKDVLKTSYHSIKSQPLEWAVDDDESEDISVPPELQRRAQEDLPSLIGHNPFLEMPNSVTATEYKKGYVMRKCCVEPNGKRTPLGKRSWKMFYVTLKDLILYLHKDEHGFKKNQLYDNLHNSIRIHHSLATKANDYGKKQHVFRLQTAEWAEYLFQTSDSKELQSWIDTINFVAASLSASPLAGAVGSQRKFQRPLLPCSQSKMNLREQLHDHEKRLMRLEQELEDHRSKPPERGAKSRLLNEYQEKEIYLQYEIKRYRTYVLLLRSKLVQHPELEPSLVETLIGEVDEREGDGASGEYFERDAQIATILSDSSAEGHSGAPRSLTDRSKFHPLSRSASSPISTTGYRIGLNQDSCYYIKCLKSSHSLRGK
ncbi:hypothetical protein CHUAL_002395 [Chamberlinius hualienensis]